MRLIKDPQGRYIFLCRYEERKTAFGFSWNKEGRYWFTTNPAIAIKCAAWADDELRAELQAAAKDLPDPTKAILTLKDGVFRYFSPYQWNHFAKDAGFRAVKEPYWHWWTEDKAAAVRCYQAAMSLGPDFLCEGEAQLLLKAELSKTINALAASRALEATVDLLPGYAFPPPTPGCIPLPCQVAAVVYAKDKDVVIFGDEQRIGKTIEAIGWSNCHRDIKRVLVITKATIKLNWVREWRKWSTLGLSVGVAWGYSDWPDTDVVIANAQILGRPKDATTVPVLLKSGKPKMKMSKGRQVPVTRKIYPLREEVQKTQWDLVIVDEVHHFRTIDTARHQYLSALQPKKRCALTGTLTPNGRAIEIWPVLNWLDPVSYPEGGRFKWAIRYAGAQRGPFGWDMSGATHLDEFQQKLRSKYMVRRLFADVYKEFPKLRRQLIEFRSPDDRFIQEQERLWKRYTEIVPVVASDVATDVNEHHDNVRTLKSDKLACFEEMSRVRHEDALKRIPFIVEHIQGLLEETPKLICCAWHNDVIERLAAEFPDAIVIYGKTTQNQRVPLQDRFNNDAKVPLCLVSIPVCEGLDLSAASLMVMAEWSWVPGDIAQAEARMSNPFKKDASLVQYCVFEDSLDARQAQTLVYKEEVGYDALDRETAQLAEIVNVATPESNPVVLPEKREAFGPTSPSEPFEFAGRSYPTAPNGNASPALSSEDCAAIHAAVRRVAGMCDGAFVRDGTGFGAFDVRVGHWLASLDSLNSKTATMALSVLKKYRHTQLNGELDEYYS